MILVDTSVWIDHLRHEQPRLVHMLDEVDVCVHPMIIAELAMGTLADRGTILELLSKLPSTAVASHRQVLHLVETRSLYGRGLSVVDAHLLASSLITPDVSLWTRDRRLRGAAEGLEVAADVPD